MDSPKESYVMVFQGIQLFERVVVPAQKAPVFAANGGRLHQPDVLPALRPVGNQRLEVVTMGTGIVEEFHDLHPVPPDSARAVNNRIVFPFDKATGRCVPGGQP